MLEDAKTRDKSPSHFSQLPTGRWHSPKNTQGKKMFELAKMLWIFERINEVTLINLKLGE